jgi:hypothetical protein
MKRIDKLSKNILKYPTRKEAMLESDYTGRYSESGHILKTKQYKEKMKPVVDQLIAERQRILNALIKKNLTKEEYKNLVDSLDKMTRNIQLLSGGATERVTTVEISEAIAKKYDSNATSKQNSNRQT